jgi:N4-gp56 family major capsid protein
MAGQIWSQNTAGGYFYSKQLSDVLRNDVQPLVKFRQFCDVLDQGQQGKHRGQTFTWDVVSDLATPGGVLTETNTMPETGFTVSQGTLTVTELGNAVPFTGLLQDLSKFKVEDIVKKSLKNDAVKAFDRLAWAQFNATPLRAIASSGTDTAAVTLYENGTVTGTNSVAFNNAHLKSIVDTMKTRNIPAFLGDDYYAIASPLALRTLKNNLETLHTYTDTGFKLIMNGEIGRYENTRFVEQTNIAAGVGTNGISTANGGDMAAWTNGKSDWIYFFGEDTVGEAITVEEEVRAKIPTDYGRSQGISWYYVGGFGLIHSYSNAGKTAAKNARIVMWDSAK